MNLIMLQAADIREPGGNPIWLAVYAICVYPLVLPLLWGGFLVRCRRLGLNGPEIRQRCFARAKREVWHITMLSFFLAVLSVIPMAVLAIALGAIGVETHIPYYATVPIGIFIAVYAEVGGVSGHADLPRATG